jgi:alpha-pyrone synthase
MSLAILGFGTAVPSATFNQQEALKIAEVLCCRTPEQTTWLPAMYSGTGIESRHTCLGRPLVDDLCNGTRLSGSVFLPKADLADLGPTTQQRMQIYREVTPDLAIRAAGEALASAGKLPTDVTHLVTVSCTGFAAPGFDVAMIRDLGMNADVERTHVGFMGCHAALNGLRVANSYAKADPNACVLVCCVELCTLHYHYGFDPGKLVANAIFADGAAAMVGVPEERAPKATWRVQSSGSCILPESEAAMTWTIGDHGYLMTLSKKIPEAIQKNLKPWMERWLAGNGLKLSDVATWAVHPGGPKIIESAGSALGLSNASFQASWDVLSRHGNMSSATLLFVLRRLQEQKAKVPCVALGFGPGLNIEAALIA